MQNTTATIPAALHKCKLERSNKQKYYKMNTRNKYYLLAFLMLFSKAFAQCPIYGDKPRFANLDSLKNRNFTGCVDTCSLTEILNYTGDDTNQYSSDQYVHFEGFVKLVKYGGSETCNCHSKNKEDLDIHIELVLNPNDNSNQSMVVEINRYTRKDHPEYSLINLKNLIGKKCSVEGFMFFDEEHKQNAQTTNPSGTHNWRYTCWEVHPVIQIIKL